MGNTNPIPRIAVPANPSRSAITVPTGLTPSSRTQQVQPQFGVTMFPLHEIPTFIESKKHSRRYYIDLDTKRKIRLEKARNKTSQTQLAKNFNLPIAVIRRILKEQT